jgi:hypothetical protein
MLFDRDQEVLAALLTAIRDRSPDRSPIDVFRVHTSGFWERIKAPVDGEMAPAQFWTVVESNPGLRDHAEIVFSRQARAVGVALARERDLPEEDLLSHAVARALCGVNSAILTCGLDRIARGDDPSVVAGEMLTEADRAYDLLEQGLARSA